MIMFKTVLIYIAFCSVFVICNENVGPSILSNPRDTIAIPGSNVSLFCITSGSPTPKVVWEKDGVVVTGNHVSISSNGALTIVNANKNRDSGFYRCRSSNAVGAVVSLKAKLDFPFLDSFLEPFSKMQAAPGNALVLKCHVPAMQPLSLRSVRWSKKDFRYGDLLPPLEKRSHYSVSRSGDLYFSHVTSADTGSYVCIVGNTLLGRNVERTVKLKVAWARENTYEVRAPGVFSEFTKTKFAVEGKAFVLECIGYGRPVPRISLRKAGSTNELGKVTRNKLTYVISSFGSEHAGEYVCKTLNDYGDWSEARTTISMLVEAKWTGRPQDMSVDVNSSLTWHCKAEGVPPITYIWLRNGVTMKQNAASDYYIIDEGTLSFPRVQVDQGGMYQCHASNSIKELITAAALTVNAAPPSFGEGSIIPNEVSSALHGGTAVISCKPIGYPKPEVTWYKGATLLERSGTRYSVSDEGSLRIFSIEKNDRGSYTCVGKNGYGTVTKETYLMIKAEIVIVNFPRSVTATVGRNLNITCEAEVERATSVTFHWKRNSMSLNQDNVKVFNDIRARKSVLSFKNLALKNSGVYSCTATTAVGKSSDYADIRIAVKGPPSAPISISASDVTQHHVNITWEMTDYQPDNNSPIKEVIVEYKTLYEKDVWYTFRNLRMRGENKAEVEISPWAFYSFRVLLVNDIGRSQPSPVSALVQSPAAVPDNAPRNITGLGPSPTELTISWQPLKAIEHNGPGLHYAVFFRRVKDPSPMTRVEVQPGISKDKLEYTVTDTEFYEQFEFQVQAINALGPGPKSAIVYGYSGEKSPVGSPQNLKVQILNSRSARATWSGIRSSREASRGKLLGYKVYYWSTEHGMRPSDALYEPTDSTATMLGLDSFTTYFFQVVAYNNKGDGPGSNVVGPLSTPESVPEAPYSLDVHVINPEVTLTWKPPFKTNGIMVGYQVTVRKLPVGQVNILDVNNERQEQEFEALDLNGKYQFALLARNRVGFGPPLVVNIDLNLVPKKAPEDIFISVDKKERRATVKWSKVDGKIDGYRVTYWNTRDGLVGSSKFQELDIKSNREIDVPGLDENLTYKFQVQSYQEFGNSLVLGPISKIHTVCIGKSNSKPRSSGLIQKGSRFFVMFLSSFVFFNVIL